MGNTKQLGRKWTEGEARTVLADWDRSGKSGAAFARSLGIDAQRLFWWRRRFSARPVPSEPAFLPVVASTPFPAERSAAPLVVTTTHVRIEVHDVDAATAAWVGAVLREERGA